jgi:type II secretory pathway pseudopilin PulG
MTCPRCQTANLPGAAACTSCGFVLRRTGPAAGGQRKGLAIASLIIGLLSLPTLAGLGIGALTGIVLGIVALMKASQSPAEYGGKGLAIGGIIASAVSFLAIPVLGIIAAIAIPSLLRARVSANEAAAIGDTRSVISAEAAYQYANAGHYDSLECLVAPGGCIPNYPANGPTFVGSDFAVPVRAGYRRSFHPGPAASGSGAGTSFSRSSIESFAYVAEPEAPNRTGVRSFCGDASGMVCSVMNGPMPAIAAGRCPSECQPLR